MTKNRQLIAATLVLGLTGCPGLSGLKVGGSQDPGTGGETRTDSKTQRLGSLTFTTLSDQTAQQLGLFGSSPASQTSGTRAGPADVAKSEAPASGLGGGIGSDGGAVVGNSGSALVGGNVSAPVYSGGSGLSMPAGFSPYMYQTYFPGPYGMMRLASVTEATTAGASGTFKQVFDKVAAPVLADWAADATLVETNAQVDDKGQLLITGQSFPGMYGWRFTYAAVSQREVLMFLVSPKETRVLRFKWETVTISPSSIAIDSDEAVAKVAAAIRNPAFKSKEEELGRDYFFSGDQAKVGYPSSVPGPITMTEGKMVAPMPMPAPTVGASGSPYVMSTPPPYYWTEETKEENLYDLKAGGSWNMQTSAIASYLVWQMYYQPSYDYPTPKGEPLRAAPMATPAPMMTTAASATDPYEYKPYEPVEGSKRTWETFYVNAMVDARTGDIIRLTRPRRYTATTVKVPITYQNGYPIRMPYATPAPMATTR